MSTAACLVEGAFDEALVEPITAALFNALARLAHDAFEHAGLDPLLEPAMCGAPGAELGGTIRSLRTVIENPEYGAADVALGRRRPPALRADRRIRNPLAQPIYLLIRQCQHDT